MDRKRRRRGDDSELASEDDRASLASSFFARSAVSYPEDDRSVVSAKSAKTSASLLSFLAADMSSDTASVGSRGTRGARGSVGAKRARGGGLKDSTTGHLSEENDKGRLIEQSTGSRLPKQAPGGHLLEQTTGSRLPKQVPGGHLLEQTSGSRLPEQIVAGNLFPEQARRATEQVSSEQRASSGRLPEQISGGQPIGRSHVQAGHFRGPVSNQTPATTGERTQTQSGHFRGQTPATTGERTQTQSGHFRGQTLAPSSGDRPHTQAGHLRGPVSNQTPATTSSACERPHTQAGHLRGPVSNQTPATTSSACERPQTQAGHFCGPAPNQTPTTTPSACERPQTQAGHFPDSVSNQTPTTTTLTPGPPGKFEAEHEDDDVELVRPPSTRSSSSRSDSSSPPPSPIDGSGSDDDADYGEEQAEQARLIREFEQLVESGARETGGGQKRRAGGPRLEQQPQQASEEPAEFGGILRGLLTAGIDESRRPDVYASPRASAPAATSRAPAEGRLYFDDGAPMPPRRLRTAKRGEDNGDDIGGTAAAATENQFALLDRHVRPIDREPMVRELYGFQYNLESVFTVDCSVCVSATEEPARVPVIVVRDRIGVESYWFPARQLIHLCGFGSVSKTVKLRCVPNSVRRLADLKKAFSLRASTSNGAELYLNEEGLNGIFYGSRMRENIERIDLVRQAVVHFYRCRRFVVGELVKQLANEYIQWSLPPL